METAVRSKIDEREYVCGADVKRALCLTHQSLKKLVHRGLIRTVLLPGIPPKYRAEDVRRVYNDFFQPGAPTPPANN